ncbi:MAG: phosphatidylglycerophosphatase A [Rhodospirillales bacterium]
MDDVNANQGISGRPGLGDPAILLATWFGAGLLPVAPGTWGSLAALPLAWLIQLYFGWAGLLAGAAVVFAAGVWSAGVYIRTSGQDDPGPVVIDEVAGQWLVLVPVYPDPVLYGVGFLVFRFVDILKPWPVSWADREIKGGFGVMLDDVLAAAYGAVVVYALSRIAEG